MKESGSDILKDQQARVHDYLRISLTDNCNFRCAYCMPGDLHSFLPSNQLMYANEIFEIAKVFVELGVKKIRLTGGEPMVRKDFAQILRTLSTLDVELLITTNGTRIHQYLELLKECGVKTLNVSLDSLDPESFVKITKRNLFHLVRKNIDLLLKNDFRVKINVVAMKSYILHELYDFIEMTKHLPVHVRFIEFMPFAGNGWHKEDVITAPQLLDMVLQDYDVVKLNDEPHSTAKKYNVIGYAGSFAFITSMSNHFCSQCNRLRITADGKIKNCLFGVEEFDLLSAMRKGESLLPIIKHAVLKKHAAMGGQFVAGYQSVNTTVLENRSMIKIGG